MYKNVSFSLDYNSSGSKWHSRRQRRVQVVPLDVLASAIAVRGRKFLSADGTCGADYRLFSRAGAKSAVRGQKFTVDDEAASRFAGQGKGQDPRCSSPSSIASGELLARSPEVRSGISSGKPLT